MTRTVLCYGDSNTWGYDPVTKDRFPRNIRWTGVLQAALGAAYVVIEEGQNGRTTVWDDPIEGYKNGLTYLIPCLETHRPLDLVIIMLGTNDLKARFNLPAVDIASGAGVLARTVLQSDAGSVYGTPPKVLLIAPPPTATLSDFAEILTGAAEKSKHFAELYRRVATELSCDYLDSAAFIHSSDLDGIHLEQAAHRRLGEAIAVKVKETLG